MATEMDMADTSFNQVCLTQLLVHLLAINSTELNTGRFIALERS